MTDIYTTWMITMASAPITELQGPWALANSLLKFCCYAEMFNFFAFFGNY